MLRAISLTAALVFAIVPAKPAAAANVAELLMEEHYSENGYEIELFVTVAADVLSEATLTDPATGDTIDVWTDGATIWWQGTIDGLPTQGSMLTLEVGGDSTSPEPQPLCFTPITAILCLGAAVVLAGSRGCRTFCIPDGTSEVHGGHGGVPPAPRDRGGDGDSGGSGSTGGGDED